MYYIVLGLEFNQDFPALQDCDFKRYRSVFEIIQIGDTKLDFNINIIDTFNHYIKPTTHSIMGPFITELIEVTAE